MYIEKYMQRWGVWCDPFSFLWAPLQIVGTPTPSPLERSGVPIKPARPEEGGTMLPAGG